MTGSATALQSVSSEVERWDAFIGWARRFAEWDQFDRWERNYKLEVGANLQAARDALLSNAPDWFGALKRAFGRPNTLSNWRFNDVFLK